ncbi:MAG: hypothetical protein V2A54_14130 [Bacteroidota bacterium]
MILTDYYKAEKLPSVASKTRYDVTFSTGGYEPLEVLKNKKGELFFHYGDVPPAFRATGRRLAEKCISKGKNISSVFVPDVTLQYAHGDCKNTLDALLIVFSDDYMTIEIFVARGQRNNQQSLYFMLCDGELNDEVEALRKQAARLLNQ